MYLRYCNIQLDWRKNKKPLPFTLWPFKSQVSTAARAPFNLYAHYPMFSLLDEKDVYVMGQCPVCRFKVKP